MKKLLLLLTCSFLLFSFNRKELTWVAIGDSITYLNDHPDETGNRITKGYMTGVTEKLPYIHFINQGHNGWTSGNIAEKIDSLGIIKAAVYSVFLGTNDWWQGRKLGSISDYRGNTGNNTVYGSFRIIINKLRKLNKHAKIILVTPMQRTDFVYINDYSNNAYGSYKEKDGQLLSQFADAITTIANEEKFDIVDLYNNADISIQTLVKYKHLRDSVTHEYKNYPYPDYIGIPFNAPSDEYPYPVDAIDMTYDGLHPSDKCFAVITDMLVKVLSKY